MAGNHSPIHPQLAYNAEDIDHILISQLFHADTGGDEAPGTSQSGATVHHHRAIEACAVVPFSFDILYKLDQLLGSWRWRLMVWPTGEPEMFEMPNFAILLKSGLFMPVTFLVASRDSPSESARVWNIQLWSSYSWLEHEHRRIELPYWANSSHISLDCSLVIESSWRYMDNVRARPWSRNRRSYLVVVLERQCTLWNHYRSSKRADRIWLAEIPPKPRPPNKKCIP